MKFNQEYIGKRIKEIRKSRGMSQMALADKIDISWQQLQKYEYGKTNISLTKLNRIAKALEVHVYVILKGDNPIKPNKEETRLLLAYRKLEDKDLKKRFTQMLEEVMELTALVENCVDNYDLTP